jgi:ABC-2 type transport system ATP-binding protein
METVLQVQDVSKVIKGKKLVDNITFSVYQGEVFGFLGPNGAGKTTTIRMLVGLISPSSGEITIGGYNITTEFKDAMRQVGCIVENPELYSYLTGWENLVQFGRMLGTVDEKRIEEIARMVHLDQRIHEKVKNYSLGMKQRLGIAQALLGAPKLLILDEPTNGLDPAGIRELREFIHTLVREQKISVFISSHLLSEIQMICDRVGIIHKGKIIHVSTVEDLINDAAEQVEWVVTPIEKATKLLNTFDEMNELRLIDDKIICRMPLNLIKNATKKLVSEDIDIHSVRPLTVTLEDLFMQLTGGELHA